MIPEPLAVLAIVLCMILAGICSYLIGRVKDLIGRIKDLTIVQDEQDETLKKLTDKFNGLNGTVKVITREHKDLQDIITGWEAHELSKFESQK